MPEKTRKKASTKRTPAKKRARKPMGSMETPKPEHDGHETWQPQEDPMRPPMNTPEKEPEAERQSW